MQVFIKFRNISLFFFCVGALNASNRFLSISGMSEEASRVAKQITAPVIKQSHPKVNKFLKRFDGAFLHQKSWFSQNPLTDTLEQFPYPWHVFLVYYCQPNALKNLQDGFPKLQHSDQLRPRRSRKHLSFLDYNYLPHSLGLSVMDRWIKTREKLLTKECTERKTDLSLYQIHLFDRKLHTLIDQMHKPYLISREKEIEKIPKKFSMAMSPHELSLYFLEVEGALGESCSRQYISYPNISGLPLSLFYQNGLLVEAYVDHFNKSSDILEIVKQNTKIPHVISANNNMTITGKIYLKLNELNSINAARQLNGLRPWQEGLMCINSAFDSEGLMDNEIAERLSYVFEDIDNLPDSINNYQKVVHFLSRSGFPVLHHTAFTKGELDLIFPYILGAHSSYQFEVLGQKVRLMDFNEESLLTEVNQITYLNKPQFFIQSVKNVKFKVLDNGCIVACITVSPFIFNKKSYSHFFVHNLTHYEEFNFHKGDDVQIICFQNKKPYLYRNFANGSGKPYYFPSDCPQCQSALNSQTKEDDTCLTCAAHLVCEGIETASIKQFVSFSGFRIQSLTLSLLERMVSLSLITEGSDIFDLSHIDIDSLKDITQEQFEKILKDIEKAKKIPLGRFIYALGVPSVTPYMANGLAHVFGTLDKMKLINKKSLQNLSFLDEEAKVAVLNFFSNSGNVGYINKILSKGIILEEYKDAALALCFQDKNSITRKEYEQLAKSSDTLQGDSNRSDQTYDLIVDALKEIEEINPSWKKQKKSAANKNITLPDDFIKMQKTYRANVFQEWLSHVPSEDKVEVLPKINGVACFLVLQNGLVQSAYTKGSNNTHIDIRNLIQNLSVIDEYHNLSGVLRGELFITRDGLKKINEEREKSGLKPYVDSLSAVVAAVNKNTLDSSFLSQLKIYFFGFGGIDGVEEKMLTGQDVYALLRRNKIGFTGIQPKLFVNKEEAVRYCTDSFSRRLDYNIDLDGMVACVRSKDNLIRRYVYKFDLETQDTRVIGVSFSMTKSGRLSAIVSVEPITFSNARTVKQVFVENHSFFDLNPIGAGSIVKVQFIGGVKASLLSSKTNDSVDRISVPSICPLCQQKMKLSGSANRICGNQHCKKNKQSNELLNFFHRLGLTIKNPERASIVTALVDKGLIVSKKDLFLLDVENMRNVCDLTAEQIGVFYHMMSDLKTLSPLKIIMSFKGGRADSENSVENILRLCNNPLDIFNLTDEQLHTALEHHQGVSLWRKFLHEKGEDLRLYLSHLQEDATLAEMHTLSVEDLRRELATLEEDLLLGLQRSYEALRHYDHKMEETKKLIPYNKNFSNYAAKKELLKQLEMKRKGCSKLMDYIDKYLKSL